MSYSKLILNQHHAHCYVTLEIILILCDFHRDNFFGTLKKHVNSIDTFFYLEKCMLISLIFNNALVFNFNIFMIN